MSEGVGQPPPLVLALVMADDVRRDPHSGKHLILGTFDIITAATFPCRHPSVAVYLSTTGGRGDVPIRVRLVDVDETRAPVLECNQILHFTDPTQLIESSFVFHCPVFPVPDDYRLQ